MAIASQKPGVSLAWSVWRFTGFPWGRRSRSFGGHMTNIDSLGGFRRRHHELGWAGYHQTKVGRIGVQAASRLYHRARMV